MRKDIYVRSKKKRSKFFVGSNCKFDCRSSHVVLQSDGDDRVVGKITLSGITAFAVDVSSCAERRFLDD